MTPTPMIMQPTPTSTRSGRPWLPVKRSHGACNSDPAVQLSEPAVSADGRYVAFGSYAENLTPVTDPYDPCDLNVCPSGFSFVKEMNSFVVRASMPGARAMGYIGAPSAVIVTALRSLPVASSCEMAELAVAYRFFTMRPA